MKDLYRRKLVAVIGKSCKEELLKKIKQKLLAFNFSINTFRLVKSELYAAI
jgi:hypothetical protein